MSLIYPICAICGDMFNWDDSSYRLSIKEEIELRIMYSSASFVADHGWIHQLCRDAVSALLKEKSHHERSMD